MPTDTRSLIEQRDALDRKIAATRQARISAVQGARNLLLQAQALISEYEITADELGLQTAGLSTFSASGPVSWKALPHNFRGRKPRGVRPAISPSVPGQSSPLWIAKCEVAKKQFFDRGDSVIRWASVNQFSPAAVYKVLAGITEGAPGEMAEIAVALGILAKAETD